MNNIITTSIVDPAIQQPFTGPSLEFLQNAEKSILLGLAQSIIGESYDNTKAYILKGVNAYGTNQYHEGYILYGGEVYYCAGKATTTAFSNIPIMTITVTNDATADPVEFTDLVSRNVHNNRNIVLSDGLTGTGTFDLSAAVYVQVTADTWHTVGSLLNSWTANNPVRYIKIGNTVHIEGDVTNAGSLITPVFTLPSGYRPSFFVNMLTSEVGAVDVVVTGGIDTAGNVTVQSAAGTNKRRIFYMSFTVL